MDSGLTSRGLPGGSVPERGGAGGGRRKAATEIMPWVPWRGGTGGFPGENDTPGDCGRERCEAPGLGLGGSSGGVRKDVLLRLDSEGEDGRASTILGGGSCDCCFGSEDASAPDGDGGAITGEGRSEERRGTGGDPDTGPRARAKVEEAGIIESLLDRGDTAGGVLCVGGAKGGGGSSLVGG